MTHKIVFTGGGTAGHVTPNVALISELKKEGWDIDYLGTKNSVEQEIISDINVPFHSVNSGKLRRYFSWKNFIDPIKILFGIAQSTWKLFKLKPDIVFSKGGFVAFPVVVGAWLNRIPVVVHESDMSPGLANRLCFPFASKICLTFEPALKFIKSKTLIEVTGTPIRAQLLEGSKIKGLEYCKFNSKKPCLLVVGGSLGSQKINDCVRAALLELLQSYQIIHICGKGNFSDEQQDQTGYFQVEYAKEELADLFAAADIVISRAGANALYEILAFKKPHILIPLSKKASRGDQIQNAKYFKAKGISSVIVEEKLSKKHLLEALQNLQPEINNKIAAMEALAIESGTQPILKVIHETLS